MPIVGISTPPSPTLQSKAFMWYVSSHVSHILEVFIHSVGKIC